MCTCPQWKGHMKQLDLPIQIPWKGEGLGPLGSIRPGAPHSSRSLFPSLLHTRTRVKNQDGLFFVSLFVSKTRKHTRLLSQGVYTRILSGVRFRLLFLPSLLDWMTQELCAIHPQIHCRPTHGGLEQGHKKEKYLYLNITTSLQANITFLLSNLVHFT